MGGANVYATNNMNDYVYFTATKEVLTLAGNNKAQSYGFGVILIQLHPQIPLIPIAPVYYCPTATAGILSLPAIVHYNGFLSVTLQTSHSILFRHKIYKQPFRIHTEQNNILDYLTVSIYRKIFSPHSTVPMIQQLLHPSINDQLMY